MHKAVQARVRKKSQRGKGEVRTNYQQGIAGTHCLLGESVFLSDVRPGRSTTLYTRLLRLLEQHRLDSVEERKKEGAGGKKERSKLSVFVGEGWIWEELG